MPQAPQTPQSIVDGARALIPLVGTLNASGDPAKQAQAEELHDEIEDAMDRASDLASDDVVKVLTGSGPLAQLAKLDAQAKTAAQKIAADESKVAGAIGFCTSAIKFVVAIETGNAVLALSQLNGMLGNLGIT
jgi:hypothetical protein